MNTILNKIKPSKLAPILKRWIFGKTSNGTSSLSSGFTLVEVLVSLVILTVALVPILILSNAASRVSITIQDNLIAAGLAQEGVEVIRAIRDTNWFNSSAFDSGLDAGTYQIEWNSVPPLSFSVAQPLNLNNNQYTYSGGIPSKFSRTVTIQKVNAGELRVTSEVTWRDRYKTSKTVSTESHLFNWR